MNEKRQVYQRLVEASLLIEEASAQALRAAKAAGKFRQPCSKNQLISALGEMEHALQRSSECTQRASTLIKVA